MEAALTSVLLNYAPLQALVGTRVNWNVRRQGEAAPFVILQVISKGRSPHYQGHDAIIQSRVQVDVWGSTKSECLSIASVIQTRLLNFRGTAAGTEIQGIFFEMERDGYDAPSTPDKFFRVSTDYMIWHKGA